MDKKIYLNLYQKEERKKILNMKCIIRTMNQFFVKHLLEEKKMYS